MLPFKSTWAERTGEDWLLKQYHARLRGDIIAEVRLAADRSLDGVHFSSGKKGKIYRWSDLGSNPKKRVESLRALVTGEKVDLIEIKPRLRLGAIGQIIFGSDMFTERFNQAELASVLDPVLLCGKGLVNPSLRWVCESKLGIRIDDKTKYKYKSDPKPFYRKKNSEIPTFVQRYWDRYRGEIYTFVPVSGASDNVNPLPVVDAICVISRQNSLQAFDRALHQKRIQGKNIELLEVAPIVDRGTMGQALGGALLMERRYGVKVRRRIVWYGGGPEVLIEGLKRRGMDCRRWS